MTTLEVLLDFDANKRDCVAVLLSSLEPLQDSGTSVVTAGKVIADNPKDTLAKTEERRKEMEKRVPFLQEFFSK